MQDGIVREDDRVLATRSDGSTWVARVVAIGELDGLAHVLGTGPEPLFAMVPPDQLTVLP